MPELYPEDQAKVDAYLNSSENRVKRKPFRPLLLLLILVIILAGMSVLALVLAQSHGVV